MYFESVSDLLTMDGHGPYVWSAYAIVTVAMLVAVVAPVRRHRAIVRQLSRRRDLGDDRSTTDTPIQQED